MASSASSIATPTFNGTSTFSASFQQVLTRAVQQASLPMQQMQNTVNDLTSQQNALTQLESTFQSLDVALQGIGGASAGNPSATVSNSAVVSASTTSSALSGTYSIEVGSLGSYSTSMSQLGSSAVTDPTTQNISSATSFTLTVNGTNTTISPADNSLEGLASAINSSSAGVQATIVNLGSNTSADYRLVVTSNNLGPDSIQLSDGTNLLSSVSTGAEASYTVNGSNSPVQSTSRQVTLSPGLTVNLLGTSTQPVSITVSTDYSGLQNALSNFASAYNSAVNGVAGQIGQNAGALAGQNIVYTLRGMLQSIANYSSGSGGSVASLSDLGLTVDSTGQMSFDASTFSAANPAAITQFLGSATSGGFMQTASADLAGVDDTSKGTIETEYAALQSQINQQNDLITSAQTRISDMQTNLMNELTQADAAIATLQSQKTYYQDLFTAEYGNGTGTSGG